MESDKIERSLTRIKDIDLKILQNLDDKSLLNFSQTSKYGNNLYQNENFWRNRIQIRYMKALEFKLSRRNWKNYYLNIVYYMNKLKDNNERMYLAAKKGEKDLVDFFISKGANNFSIGMEKAAFGGHLELVKYFIFKSSEEGEWNEYNRNRGLVSAFQGGHKNIFDFFRTKGSDVNINNLI